MTQKMNTGGGLKYYENVQTMLGTELIALEDIQDYMMIIEILTSLKK